MAREDLFVPNLTLRFFIGTGKFDLDENDNPIERTDILNVYARVSQSQNPRYYQMPGITLTDIVVGGNIVSLNCNGVWIPDTLPTQINLETVSEGELNLFERRYKGQFRFIPEVQPVFRNLRTRFGEAIRGFLKVSSRN